MSWNEHDITLVEEKYRQIVQILLDYEESLSDGYKYYCEFNASEQAKEYYKDDYILATLVEIAKEILGENREQDIRNMWT